MSLSLPSFINPSDDEYSNNPTPEQSLEDAIQKLTGGGATVEPRNQGTSNYPDARDHLKKTPVRATYDDTELQLVTQKVERTKFDSLPQAFLHHMKHGLARIIYGTQTFFNNVSAITTIHKLLAEKEHYSQIRDELHKGNVRVFVESPLLGRPRASMTPQDMAQAISIQVSTRVKFFEEFLKKGKHVQEALENSNAVLFQNLSGLYQEQHKLREMLPAGDLELLDFYLDNLAKRLQKVDLDEKLIALITSGENYHKEHEKMLNRLWPSDDSSSNQLGKEMAKCFYELINLQDIALTERISTNLATLSLEDRARYIDQIKEGSPITYAIEEYLQLEGIDAKDPIIFSPASENLQLNIPKGKLQTMFVACVPVRQEDDTYTSKWLILDNLYNKSEYGLRLSEQMKSCIYVEAHGSQQLPVHLCNNWLLVDATDLISITDDEDDALHTLKRVIERRDTITNIEDIAKSIRALSTKGQLFNAHTMLPHILAPKELLDLYRKSPNHSAKHQHMMYPNTTSHQKNSRPAPINASLYQTIQDQNTQYIPGSITSKVSLNLNDPKPTFTANHNFPSVFTGNHIQALHESFFQLHDSHQYSSTLQSILHKLPEILGAIPEDTVEDWFTNLAKHQYINLFEHFGALYPEKYKPIDVRTHINKALHELSISNVWELIATIASIDQQTNDYKELQDTIKRYGAVEAGEVEETFGALIKRLEHDTMMKKYFSAHSNRISGLILELASSPEYSPQFYHLLERSPHMTTVYERLIAMLSPLDKATFLKDTFVTTFATVGSHTTEGSNVITNDRLYKQESFSAFAYEYVFHIIEGLCSVHPAKHDEVQLHPLTTLHKPQGSSLPALPRHLISQSRAIQAPTSEGTADSTQMDHLNLSSDEQSVLANLLQKEAQKIGKHQATKTWMTMVIDHLYPEASTFEPEYLDVLVKKLSSSQSYISEKAVFESVELYIDKVITERYEKKEKHVKGILNTLKTPLLAAHLLHIFEEYQKSHHRLTWKDTMLLHEGILNSIHHYSIVQEGERDAIDLSSLTIDDMYSIIRSGIEQAKVATQQTNIEYVINTLFLNSINSTLAHTKYPDGFITLDLSDQDIQYKLKNHLKTHLSSHFRKVLDEVYSDESNSDLQVIRRFLQSKDSKWISIFEHAITNAVMQRPLKRIQQDMRGFFNEVTEENESSFKISISALEEDFDPQENPLRNTIVTRTEKGLRVMLDEKKVEYIKQLVSKFAKEGQVRKDLRKEDMEVVYNQFKANPEQFQNLVLVAKNNSHEESHIRLLHNVYITWLLNESARPQKQQTMLLQELEQLISTIEKDPTEKIAFKNVLIKNPLLLDQLERFFNATISSPEQCHKRFLDFSGTQVR